MMALGLAPANAQMSLTFTSGSSTTGPYTDSSIPGFISVGFGTTVGSWTLDGYDAYGPQILGLPDAIQLFGPGLSTTGSSSLAATLTESGLSAPASGSLAIVLNAGSYPGESLTAYINGNEVGTTLTASGTESVNVSGYTTPFTLKEVLVYSPDGGELISGNGELNLTASAIPEPTTMTLLLMPIAAGTLRKLRKNHAS
jgi:hypothetical protein